MKIQILTPEDTIFDGEVASIIIPGLYGEFQMLENHAAIVSALASGKIKIESIISSSVNKNLVKEDKFDTYSIKGGILEFSNNNGIILCD